MLSPMRTFCAATLFATTGLATPTLAADGLTADGALLPPADTLAIAGEVATAISPVVLGSAPILVAQTSSPAGTVDTTDEEIIPASGFELSGNVALVSDYRFRGVSFSDGDIALQGGLDLGHSSGFYVGTWASSISGGTAFGELELDVYGGYSADITDGVTVDVGLLYYIYPTGDVAGADTDYFEPYASVSTTLGPVSATLGAAYAWEQDSLGGDDNIYVYTDFETAIPDTPVTLSAHLGYTDGIFATQGDGTSFDWGLGASYAVTDSLSLGLNYVDTQGPSIEDFTDAGFFVTLGYSM